MITSFQSKPHTFLLCHPEEEGQYQMAAPTVQDLLTSNPLYKQTYCLSLSKASRRRPALRFALLTQGVIL